ncbi:hypothetical protein SH580_08425 [Coraliomargarita algicola]|uniref:TIGR03016 family PEP-CTERM system-associated outer membrane protein n=1 Tax=Coraliomargarita algicola TaxID=3092156 RepID=A0ABZ0RR60_9BACT|nr:hypothetical protein [Coraliomargarita sp. J2-16]WPJ97734.1 hypothetical protein SH580_08425 [Coraliomargarita sp. J2-16]
MMNMRGIDQLIYQHLSPFVPLCGLIGLIPSVVFGADIEWGSIQTARIPDYNLKVGEVYFDSTIRTGLGWDSNYDQDVEAKGSAFYSVGFLTDISWMPAPSVRLNTNLDLQYLEKPKDSAGGRFLISGVDETAAAMSVAIRSGDRILTVNTKLSSSLIGLRVENGAGQQQDRSFQELAYGAGAHYARALSPNLTSNLGYTFSSRRAIGHQSEDDLASQLNAKSHDISTKLVLDANPSLRAGLYAGSTLTVRDNYTNGQQIQAYQVGLEGTYLSSYAVVYGMSLGAEYQEDSWGGADSGSAWSPKVQFSVDFRGRSNLEHQFTASYHRDFSNLVADTGVNRSDLAEYSQTFSIAYALNLDLSPTWEVRLRQELRQFDDVGSSASACRYNLNLRTDYMIAPRWTVNFTYDYTNQFDGGAKGQGYSRHIVSSSLSFKL